MKDIIKGLMKNELVSKGAPKTRKSYTTTDTFPIVGIGASAGGLEALSKFFEKITEGSKIAFIIVQHLDPTHKGMMPELLQRITSMKVIQVTDRLIVKPGYVYIIPPNRNMSILNRTLYLFERDESRGSSFPIDFFFKSLADDLRERSIGVILSGMGTDGNLGLRAIKEKSGIAIVQSPASAKFDGMPNSAIEAVDADIIAQPDELPGKLISYIESNSVVKEMPDLTYVNKSVLEKIIILLRNRTGNDFSHYKRTTLYRRIDRRMEIHKLTNMNSYLRYLQDTPSELDVLFKELLIGVTAFFRNPVVWEHLKEEILPEMFDNAPDRYTFRTWIPACATGEEAYSLAIIFLEALHIQKSNKILSLQIFGTDINDDSIAKARRGFFNPNITTEISPDRLKSFFVKTEHGFRVESKIREMIVFAPQNLINDPPFTKIDILICRNLLIYFEPVLQKKVISIFHYTLNPNGILVLGNEETIGSQLHLFKKLNNRLRIYQRVDSDTDRKKMDFPSVIPENNILSNEIEIPLKTADSIQTLTTDLLLLKFTPPSVLVNSKGDILYITGRTGKFLEPASGKANMNIFAMIRESLQLEFPIAFRKAGESYEKVVLRNVRIDTNGNSCSADIIIQQIEKPVALKGLLIVVFNEVPVISVPKVSRSKRVAGIDNSRTNELEIEIDRLKDELKSTLLAMHASEEDLRSANEELQSTNEELQSTNEELTTSKEEMQSMNEELQTVNIELINKIEDFAKINNDLKNLLESTEIATLFLDKTFKVRRFTYKVKEIFRLLPADIGRPLTDLYSDLVYPELSEDCSGVLLTLVFIEKEIITHSNTWYKVRIMPYRTTDDLIDGLVITFTDITRAKNLESQLNETISKLRSDSEFNK